jgi:hypothetical protein
MKLNLGCGKEYKSGYTNIDIVPPCDLLLDIRKLGKIFESRSIEEILIIHVLGYLNLWEVKDFLEVSYSLLQKNGILIIETPDLQIVAKDILANTKDAIEMMRPIYGFDRNDVIGRYDFKTYKTGWWPSLLWGELARVGFTHIEHLKAKFHDPTRDFRMIARREI